MKYGIEIVVRQREQKWEMVDSSVSCSPSLCWRRWRLIWTTVLIEHARVCARSSLIPGHHGHAKEGMIT
jgi:hypothetical protein